MKYCGILGLGVTDLPRKLRELTSANSREAYARTDALTLVSDMRSLRELARMGCGKRGAKYASLIPQVRPFCLFFTVTRGEIIAMVERW